MTVTEELIATLPTAALLGRRCPGVIHHRRPCPGGEGADVYLTPTAGH